MTDFPSNYVPPKQTSSYLKLENENTKVRIMKLPNDKTVVMGYKYQDNKDEWHFSKEKPKVKEEQIKEDKFGNRYIKHFWLCYVWSYDEQSFKIWEITQQSIQSQLYDFSTNPDWGSVVNYDITIKRKEENIVKYTIQPSPKIQPISEEIQKKFDKMEKIDFENRFNSEEVEKEISVEDVPF